MLQINQTIYQPIESIDLIEQKRDSRIFHVNHGARDERRLNGFRPAFLDSETGRVYLSRYADGRPAPLHIFDGLPDEVVTARRHDGTVTSVKQTLQSGFSRNGKFYTRKQATISVARYAAKKPI